MRKRCCKFYWMFGMVTVVSLVTLFGETGGGTHAMAETSPGKSPYTYRGDDRRAVAMPLGGIGAGQIALCGDGSLRQWQIFNNVNHLAYVPHSFFAISVRDQLSGIVVSRVLQSGEFHEETDFAPVPLVNDHTVPDEAKALLDKLPGVESTTFVGKYPVAQLSYPDSALPVKVELESLSPMAPLDEKASCLPLIRFVFKVTNPGESAVSVKLAATLQNAVGYDGIRPVKGTKCGSYGGNINEIVRTEDFTAINMTNPSVPEKSTGSGTMSIATTANDVETIAGWDDLESFWTAFNALVPLPTPEKTDPSGDGTTWNGALVAAVDLEPGQTHTVTFFLSWYFPNRFVDWDQPPLGRKQKPGEFWLGNYYSNMFENALDVTSFALKNDDIFRTTRAFADSFYTGSIPWWALDRIGSQMSTIRSPTCMWVEDGKFFAFEGCNGASANWIAPTGGCCPLNCTHVWNYEHTLSALYPALERTMRETDLEVQMHPSGYIPHRTMVPLSLPRPWGVTIGGPAKPALDGMLGTVLKTYREHLRTTDREWLDGMWPHVKRLLGYLMNEFDPDDDGVIDAEQPNTYDISVFGVNTFVGSLWLAALRAGEEMARIEGDSALAAFCRERFEKGSRGYDDVCWNGEYYVQVYDSDKYKRNQWGIGCHSDQLIGQWWAHILALGYVLPEDHVKQALKSIYRYNFREDLSGFEHEQRVFACGNEAGLINCTWPKGARPQIPILYCDEVWTGIEYEVASLMLFEGMTHEALRIVEAAHDRYDGTKRNPYNEIECGDHYVRAMASWSVLEAAAGYRFNGPDRTLVFMPRLDPGRFESFFIAPSGWGTVAQHRTEKSQKATLTVRYGKVELDQIVLALPDPSVKPATVRAEVGGEIIPCVISQQDEIVRIRLAGTAEVFPDDTLSIVLAW
jgi:non-lysosomal glucosylceramidase